MASRSEYTDNLLNQYTSIVVNGGGIPFIPQFDADGNQTLIKTETGIWSAVYNAENRPVTFTNTESNTVVECQYDSMGRRAYKKVTVNGSVTLHQRYIYRGYLQIACVDLTRSHHPVMWLLTWDPTQAVATRPLAIQINGTWYTYGWDLTKNICELYSTGGTLTTSYTYSPFGQVTATGSLTQSIQWSSEVWDAELHLYYYNYRFYDKSSGRFTVRDLIKNKNLYRFCINGFSNIDVLGKSMYVRILIDDYDDDFILALQEEQRRLEIVKEKARERLNIERSHTSTCRKGEDYFSWLRRKNINIKWNDETFLGSSDEFLELLHNERLDFAEGVLKTDNQLSEFVNYLENREKAHQDFYVIAHSAEIEHSEYIDAGMIFFLKSYIHNYANLITCFDQDRHIATPEFKHSVYRWRIGYNGRCNLADGSEDIVYKRAYVIRKLS